ATRLRHEALARERAILEATLTGMSDGIMMVDGNLRLLAWNQRFPEFTGVPADILRVGVPMEEILRAQALGGEFGPVDGEEDVAPLRRGDGQDRAAAAGWPAARDQAEPAAGRRLRHAVQRCDGTAADRGAVAPGADHGGGRSADRGRRPRLQQLAGRDHRER